jgi:hypothetical protein
MEELGESAPRAGDDDLTAAFADPANPADQSPEAGRIDERHPGQVEDQRQAGDGDELGHGLAEEAHREGFQLTDRTAEGAALRPVNTDIEHLASQRLARS